jgi:hypothetical protein
MRYNRRHTFYFDYLLARETEDLEVEVAYIVDDDEVMLQSVRHNGAELETTEAEDNELYTHVLERVEEDMIDAQADYGDHLRDSARDYEG